MAGNELVYRWMCLCKCIPKICYNEMDLYSCLCWDAILLSGQTSNVG
jgi:hypothetical protein